MKLRAILAAFRHWFSDTPQRALDRAYKAALAIESIEKEYFKGQKISAEFSDYSDSVVAYFVAKFNKYLQIIKMRMAEFQASCYFANINSVDAQNTAIVKKIQFIEKVISKYEANFLNGETISVDSVKLSSQELNKPSQKKIDLNSQLKDPKKINTLSNRTSILPRSLFRTFNRIKREAFSRSPEKTEGEVIKNFRESRRKTSISLRFLLILILVPFLTHLLTKTLIVNPIVEHYFARHTEIIFINTDLEDRAYSELQKFEERLRFRSLTGLAPEMSPEEIQKQVKQKAKETVDKYRARGSDAISNIFADIFSLIAFAAIVFTSRREIEIFKSFLDEIIYGLSDSAKAFLIILLTDMFVGYHSPHGWEIILESISRHFGIPESREFNFIFIATFPVILDTVLKYWIFRYLNRISPSSVATYKHMNQ